MQQRSEKTPEHLPLHNMAVAEKEGHDCSLVCHYYNKLLRAIIDATRSVSMLSSVPMCEIKAAVNHAITTVLHRNLNEYELMGVLDDLLTLSGYAEVGIIAGKRPNHHIVEARHAAEHFSSCIALSGIGAVGAVHMGEKERQMLESLVKMLGESQTAVKDESSDQLAQNELSLST